MYKEEFAAMANAATAKLSLLKRNPLGYFLLSMLAGAYIGFGILLIFTIGGLLNGNPATKLVMGLSFGVALSLVVIAGGELFTGNTMVMSSGVMEGKVSLADTIKLGPYAGLAIWRDRCSWLCSFSPAACRRKRWRHLSSRELWPKCPPDSFLS